MAKAIPKKAQQSNTLRRPSAPFSAQAFLASAMPDKTDRRVQGAGGTLLLLARYGKEDKPQGVLPKLSQEMLAEMIGRTRSRVNFFMNKFRKLGFIDYNVGTPGGLKVHASLLSVVLHD